MFQTQGVKKFKTHALISVTISESLWDNEEKYFTAEQATDENMAHARYMMDTKDNKHEIKIGNNYCSYSAKIVARKHPNIALYVLCLSFLTSRHLLQVKET